MSHYLSSFLIEPVVRQARRFSRPSFSQHDPSPDRSQDDTKEGAYVRLVEVRNLEPQHVARQYALQSALRPPLEHAQTQEAAIGQDPCPDEQTPHVPAAAIPEDDGMSSLRCRIQAIQHLNVSTQEKAVMVHQVMMAGHQALRASSVERPITPCSPVSAVSEFVATSPPTSYSTFEYNPNPFNLVANDLVPTYRRVSLEQRARSSSEQAPPSLGCQHYKRNIKLQCSSCQRWYTCRFCHDAAEDHLLNRRATQHMLCMLCGCAQSASAECVACSTAAAWYYCGVCKLWDDDADKAIYHCGDCGICRLGQGLGKDFFHCPVCLFLSLSARPCSRHAFPSHNLDFVY